MSSGRLDERLLRRLDACARRTARLLPTRPPAEPIATASTPSVCRPGIPTGCSTRPARGGFRTPISSSAGCNGGSSARDGMSRAVFSRRMRIECAALVLANVQPQSVMPYLAAARRLERPVVAYVASWDHTVGKGVISPYCDRYIVQNTVMQDDLRRYPRHRSEPGRRHRLATDGRLPSLPAALRIRRAPAFLRARSSPAARHGHGQYADEHALRGPVRRAARVLVGAGCARSLPASLQASPAGQGVARPFRCGDREGRHLRAGPELHRPRAARRALAARGCRRRQRGHHPPRRDRERPTGSLRPLRRGSTGGRVVGREERRRQALRGARRVGCLLPGRVVRGGRGRSRSRAFSSPASSKGHVGASSERSSAMSTDRRPSVSSTRSLAGLELRPAGT